MFRRMVNLKLSGSQPDLFLANSRPRNKGFTELVDEIINTPLSQPIVLDIIPVFRTTPSETAVSVPVSPHNLIKFNTILLFLGKVHIIFKLSLIPPKKQYSLQSSFWMHQMIFELFYNDMYNYPCLLVPLIPNPCLLLTFSVPNVLKLQPK
ncbi:UNVERIFIED_CONTAM: hypothetical protein RMT77_009287 [Armadillidium vulgare]